MFYTMWHGQTKKAITLPKFHMMLSLVSHDFSQSDTHDVLNNKLMIKSRYSRNRKVGIRMVGEKQAERNLSIRLHFCSAGLANTIVVRTLLFIWLCIKGRRISSTTVYICYVTESNERLFRIHLDNVFVGVTNRLICCCAASQPSHRRFSSENPATPQSAVSVTVQG